MSRIENPHRRQAGGQFNASTSQDALGQTSVFRLARFSTYLFKQTSFGLHLQQHYRTYRSALACSETVGLPFTSVESLFPMALPPRPAVCSPGQRDRISSARRRHRAGHRHVARVYAEMLVSIFNDWAVEGGNPAKLDYQVGPPSALQLQTFEQLVDRLASLFRRVPFVKIGSGRGSLMLKCITIQI